MTSTAKEATSRRTAPSGPAATHPISLDLGDYLPYLVNRVGSIIAEQFGGNVLAPHRLSIAMWRVMAALAADGSQRQTDLADLTSIDASTLSRLVTRLVRMGLVSRTRSPSSSREVAVELSAKGRVLVARLIPIARQYEAAAIAGLTRQELATLKRCLRRAYENMKRRPVA
jgi:DNA-binding MarR family transcriptional regulator